MPVLSPETVIVRNERLAWRVLEGEAVILFPEAGTLHRLNETGTQTWERLDGRSLSTIAAELATEYRVDADQALRDLEDLVAEMLEADLVEISEAAAS